MKSTIAITYEDSFWESFSTCDGNSVPFLPLLPRRYLISGGSGAVLPLLSSTRNCQRSTFPDPFWMFHSQLMVDCFIHSSPCLLVGVLDAISMFDYASSALVVASFSISSFTDKVSFRSLISEPKKSLSFWCCRRLSKSFFQVQA